MIGELLFYAGYGVGTGGSVGNLIGALEQQGVFAYLLPFLLIFAVLYGVLTKIQLFGSNLKSANIIYALIAFSVALMALQFNYVSYFFSEIFPQLGMGLAVLLVAVLLFGAFFNSGDHPKVYKRVFGALVGITFIVILGNTFGWFSWLGSGFGWTLGYYWDMYANFTTFLIVIVIAVIIYLVKSNKSG